MGKRRKAEGKGPRREVIEEGLEQLPLHVVEDCLCEVWVWAREKSGRQRQEIARRMGKHPSFITKVEGVGRHVPAMELPRIAAGYGLPLREVFVQWLERMTRRWEELRKTRRAA